MSKDINIPITAGGITFKNPFFVASGPTTKSVRQLQRIEETGWAAASIKLSIDPAPYINRKPRYSMFKDRNALAFTAEKRLTFAEGLKLIEDAKKVLHDLKLMANITYAGDKGSKGWVNMSKRFEEAGADIIELNMCCPNMSYNLEMTSGGQQCCDKRTGASMGQQAEVAAEIVRAIKSEISIPLFVKLTPEGGQIAEVAKAVLNAGADAVGGTGNRLGMPPIDLDDPGKAFFHLQEEISMGCHCGPWLKPLAQRDTYEIRKVCGMEPVVTAAGGIADWRDAVEMILCGGTLLGVCAETLISGYDIVRPMIEGLKNYMDEHGYTDLEQMRGLVVPEVKTASDVTIYSGYARIKEPNLSAPCKSACPHHIPVQAYVQKVAKGDYRAAYDLITGKNALQSLCALVCNHPCEDACIRGGYDAPVKIRQIKRFVLEYGEAQGWRPAWAISQENGHKVAVIGAGPAGLSCATELVKGGYSVTVFEKNEKAGGMIRYGMPDYALNKDVIDQEAARLEALGVHFEFGKSLGTDIDEASLRKMGFEKAFVAIGAQKKAPAGIPGAGETIDALELLCKTNRGERTEFANRLVVVIGGDFAAIDAARTAVRLGAGSVTLALPGDRPKNSGLRESLRLAAEEGVKILENVQVLSICPESVRATVGGTDAELRCDKAVISNPYHTDMEVLPGIEDNRGFIKTSRDRRTGNEFFYAGGDAVRMANVITAISSGKSAAASIDREIRGEAAVLEDIPPTKTVDIELVQRRTGYLKKDANKLDLVEKDGQRRISDFDTYERVMTEAEAVSESLRCLNCGCGEGCQKCKTICCDFAPEIADTDTMHICKEDCVACGMCFNLCPNKNIEMVNLGEKV